MFHGTLICLRYDCSISFKGLSMKQLVLAVVNALAIITLSGCSNSSAATLQNEPTRPRATASLAPQTDWERVFQARLSRTKHDC